MSHPCTVYADVLWLSSRTAGMMFSSPLATRAVEPDGEMTAGAAA